MPSPKKEVGARPVKVKTAAQRKKTEENKKAAAERLAKLQAQQRVVNALRKRGYVGTEQVLLQIADQEERRREDEAARKFVEGVLSGSLGERCSRFLASGAGQGEATKVALRVRNWLQVQGLEKEEAA